LRHALSALPRPGKARTLARPVELLEVRMNAEGLAPGTVLDRRFELERLAGAGGMGLVYRALDLATGQPAAVKVLLRSGDAARFAREVRLLEGVRHPAVVRYVAEGTLRDGAPYLAMEWLDGEELVARLERAPLTIEETVTLGQRVVGALVELHARGVLHRDLKPSNLFLCGGRVEEVKLLDFGIALPPDDPRRLTRTGTMIGTPGYMAPEQARGERDAGARADLFSLGCVLFECLAGRPAFTGAHVIALLAKVLLEEAPRVAALRPEVPEALADLIERLMQKDPEDRPADAGAVSVALSSITMGGPGIERAARSPIVEGLTAGEQRLLSVILVGAEPSRPQPPALAVDPAATLLAVTSSFATPLRAVAAAHGAALAPLADGTWVLALDGTGAATDRAAQSARCALATRRVVGDAPIVLAMGRGLSGARLPVGEVAERAARLLQRRTRGASVEIGIDELTAGLLDERFAIEGEGERLALHGERDALGEDARVFLGRASLCVGRERELRALEEAFDTCASEPCAQAVIVVGEAGVGKSRVRSELLRSLRARGGAMELWMARGDPSSAGSPFGQLGQALRRAAGVLDGEPVEARRRKLLARVGRHLGDDGQRVAELLGELSGTPFPDEGSPKLRAARHDPVLMGDQMRGAWVDFLDAECRAQPVLLVLEDLHWGDLPTIQYVDAALRLLTERPFLVVAFTRPDVEARFPGLWSRRSPVVIHLGGLSRRACVELARDALGDRAGAETLDRLWERSAGNAFFLEELLRAAVAGRGGDAPPTVLAVVQARIEGLGPEARRVLRAASVFGQRFWRGGVAALLGGAPVDGALAALVDDEVVTRSRDAKFPGETEYAFRHALVREAAYGMLTEADREVGHRLAAAWLTGAGEGSAIVLAECFERGGLRGEAATWYRRAAEQAFEGNDLALVLALAQRAMACAAEGPAFDARWHGELYLLQASANRFRGQAPEMQRCALDALARLPRGSAPFYRALEAVAHASCFLHDPERLEAASRELLAADLGPDPEDLDREATRELAVSYAVSLARTAGHGLLAGQTKLTGVLLRRSEGVARRIPDHTAVTAALERAQALEVHFTGDLGSRLGLHRSARAGFQAAGDARNACIEAGNIGSTYIMLGLREEAEHVLRDGLVEVDRLGLAGPRVNLKQDLGLAVGLQGRFAEGMALQEEAIALARESGMRSYEMSSRLYLARISLVAGDTARAERESRSLLEEPAAFAWHRATGFAVLSVAAAALGRRADALAAAQQAMEILASAGELEEGESFIRLAHAEALHAIGDARAAAAAVTEARADLLARAGKIADAELRRSFLDRVPENARILALAEELLGPPGVG
jgi:eukaryotic-like serine/threonine-protein kinase